MRTLITQATTNEWNAERYLRRIVDIGLASIALLLTVPLFIAIALCIMVDSPGAILITMPRLGLGGNPFPCFKFRSMYVDGDNRLRQYLSAHPDAMLEWTTYRKLRGHDPRVTRAGKWLRRLSLDELPQFLNVFRGDISLVGPRPYLPSELEAMGALATPILSVKPGLTGLWQVSGRNLMTFGQRVELEANYAASRTLWMDLLILLKTPVTVLGKFGAF